MRLLRGRIAVRPLVPQQIGSILMPGTHADWTRAGQAELGIKAQSSHSAIVLAKGPPALEHGHERPHLFEVGDEVVYVYHHNEKWSDGHTWEDGGPVIYVAQEEILAVVE